LFNSLISINQLALWEGGLQSRTKVVETVELDHVFPIPPNQCLKMSHFFQQKEKRSPDYQHKWGRGELASCPNFFVCDCLKEEF